MTTTAAFYPSFVEHDEVTSLVPFRSIPTTILVGDCDRLTPATHSRRMAAEIPTARLVVVPGAGHSVNLTRSQVVDRAFLDLLDRVDNSSRRAG